MRRFVRTLSVTLVGVAVALSGGVLACGGVDHTALGELEDCTNGQDDNGDTLVDCDDMQCAGHAACLSMVELACANGADDDGDGHTDCDDPDCLQTSDCDPSREWSCHDGVDNDGDGLPDCLDPDCNQACTEKCDDNTDNDSDGLVDCDDPDCVDAEQCATGGEVCGNGEDDDLDGLTDCDDPDCQWRPVCRQVEICDNEIDDDDDGLVDCEDPDCALSPYCYETACADGQDNDDDTHIDCDDPDCFGQVVCQGSTECLPAMPLPCGQYLESTTEGALNNFSSYPCTAGSFPGPERYFVFTAGRELIVDITLYDWDNRALTMIAASGDPNGGCDFTNTCIPQPNEADPYLPVLIAEGATMYLIIDSPLATPGAFDLWMECTPTDEEGLCTDGLDNDYDGWYDCEDEDCSGEPFCNYWVSAGSTCTVASDCPAEEYCETIFFQGTMNTVGFCTRDCSAPGITGGECATDGYGDGLCTGAHTGQGPRCLLPCSSPGDICPPGNQCTNYLTGSTADVLGGFCLPIQ